MTRRRKSFAKSTSFEQSLREKVKERTAQHSTAHDAIDAIEWTQRPKSESGESKRDGRRGASGAGGPSGEAGAERADCAGRRGGTPLRFGAGGTRRAGGMTAHDCATVTVTGSATGKGDGDSPKL